MPLAGFTPPLSNPSPRTDCEKKEEKDVKRDVFGAGTSSCDEELVWE
jgi:hypothetical protein